jgi:hypothetical protein
MWEFIGQILMFKPHKMLNDSDDRISCLETFNFWTSTTVTYLKKIEHDVGGRGIFAILQLNSKRKTYIVGTKNRSKHLGA